MSFPKLTLDFEEFTRSALPAPPEQWHRGLTLLPQVRARVLRHAPRALQDHSVAGSLLLGALARLCQSLIPLRGRLCTGVTGRPFFTARGRMRPALEGLAMHCTAKWFERVRSPVPLRKQRAAFLEDYFPVLAGARAPLRPTQAMPRGLPLQLPQPPRPPAQQQPPGVPRPRPRAAPAPLQAPRRRPRVLRVPSPRGTAGRTTEEEVEGARTRGRGRSHAGLAVGPTGAPGTAARGCPAGCAQATAAAAARWASGASQMHAAAPPYGEAVAGSG